MMVAVMVVVVTDNRDYDDCGGDRGRALIRNRKIHRVCTSLYLSAKCGSMLWGYQETLNNICPHYLAKS